MPLPVTRCRVAVETRMSCQRNKLRFSTQSGSMCAPEQSSGGRKPRRAHDRATSLEQIAPGLSRSVALGSPRLVPNFKARFAPVRGKQHTHDTERRKLKGGPSDIALLTTASQARQRSTVAATQQHSVFEPRESRPNWKARGDKRAVTPTILPMAI